MKNLINFINEKLIVNNNYSSTAQNTRNSHKTSYTTKEIRDVFMVSFDSEYEDAQNEVSSYDPIDYVESNIKPLAKRRNNDAVEEYINDFIEKDNPGFINYFKSNMNEVSKIAYDTAKEWLDHTQWDL